MITPYCFMVITNHGLAMINLPETEWNEPVPVEVTGADDVLEEYFKRYGIGMDGMPVSIDVASPRDINHALLVNETIHKSPLIISFSVEFGYIPDSGGDGPEPVLESSGNTRKKKDVHFKQKRFVLQGRYSFQGFPISIETKRGQTRKGSDPNGQTWSNKMDFDYGYIRRTNGLDNEGIDVYVGKNRRAKYVYVVKQHKIEEVEKWQTDYCPDCKEHVWDCSCPKYFDEDKVFLGFSNREAVKDAYLKQYDNIRFLGPIGRYPVDKFKKLLWGRSNKKPVKEGLNIPLAIENNENDNNQGD